MMMSHKCVIKLGERERFNYLCIDMSRIENDGENCIFNESKTTYIECIPECELF